FNRPLPQTVLTFNMKTAKQLAASSDFAGKTFSIRRVSQNHVKESADADSLAVEEPLEIRLGFSENGKFQHKAISITMRTPGSDFELAAGFLFTEGILQNKNQISAIKHCGRFGQLKNTVRIDLQNDVEVNLKKIERNFYTTSSCGVCGKSSIEALETGAKRIGQSDFPKVSAETIHQLPEKLRRSQKVFDETGGLHAAALFDAGGNLIELREDVGRHNAVDKLIGARVLANEIPLRDKILFLSGRASFELVQKAVMAQIPVIAAVGAPSSLAVDAAAEFGVTLLGFVRENRFNIYAGFERIAFKA
ncbi:MAG TPA: formate dehydrogenase accessory sulfurtransferase FdhD, partial [Pyrinomonadaceae bacterium]